MSSKKTTSLKPNKSILKPRKATIRGESDIEMALKTESKSQKPIMTMTDNIDIDMARIISKPSIPKEVTPTPEILPDPLPIKKDRPKTREGYLIYTPEELKMGLPNSGNTPLCPFDCDCCY